MIGIQLDDELDLVVSNGTFKLGDTVDQEIECAVRANRGEYKEAPLVGGEVDKLINGAVNPNWSGNVKQQLASVGIKIKNIKFSETEIIISK